MPLTGSGPVLSASIQSALATAFPDAFPDSGASADAWNVIADTIVAHIVANSQVVITSVSGVTTGAGVSGPGTGTIT